MESSERKCTSYVQMFSVRVSILETVYPTKYCSFILLCDAILSKYFVYTGIFASATPTISYRILRSCTFSIPTGMYAC